MPTCCNNNSYMVHMTTTRLLCSICMFKKKKWNEERDHNCANTRNNYAFLCLLWLVWPQMWSWSQLNWFISRVFSPSINFRMVFRQLIDSWFLFFLLQDYFFWLRSKQYKECQYSRLFKETHLETHNFQIYQYVKKSCFF